MPLSLPPDANIPPPTSRLRATSRASNASSSAGTTSSHPPPSSLSSQQAIASGSSFRSSLGGKSIGQRYSGTNRRGSEVTPSEGSDGYLESGMSYRGLCGERMVVGSFSATREELRDGSARLASLSLTNLNPPSTTLSSSPQPPSSYPLSTSSSTIVPGRQGPNSLRPSLPGSPTKTGGERSNLSLGRPSTSAISPSISTTTKHDASLNPGDESEEEEEGGSDTTTPTQSNMGSLLPPSSAAASSSIPTPLIRKDSKSRSRSRDRKRIQVLGDEVGGKEDGVESTRNEEEEEVVEEGEGSSESEEESRERGRRGSDESVRRGKLNGTGNGRVDENTPLLLISPSPNRKGKGKVNGASTAHRNRSSSSHSKWSNTTTRRISNFVHEKMEEVKQVEVSRESIGEVGKTVVGSIPAVILGLLMNILDGVSYGMSESFLLSSPSFLPQSNLSPFFFPTVMFPTNLPVFADFGGIGVSMFFVSCVLSQVVYSGGGSIFKGGNGSMMIEVVPFFHVIVSIINSSISPDKDIVATTMVAFALSSFLMGLTFLALGALKLGSLSEFFPRHILVGCIGGVGAFLFITGLEVSARLEEDASFSPELLRHFFDSDTLPLWSLPLVLAITLRLITSRYSHPLVFPGFFLAIPLVFYIVTTSLGISVTELREAGWVFEVNGVDSEWYEYWGFFDLRKTDFGALIDTIPTQLALVFFGLLHVPINVPALGISVGEDNVNTDRELIAHGISNVLAGCFGTVPNYLCYVNSVLFYKVGGTTRISGFLLALASFGVLIMGPGVIGFLPVCVVGALIFILGLDLVKEAVWDTYGRVAQFEYITIWAIIITMTVYDFVMGIGVGIILACVSFVVSSSQRRAVRSILNGAVARSTVRRHPKQSAFLKEVGRQTRVIKLHNFLFFGTISACEGTIRKILEAAEWSKNPIRFLVLDFSMATGVDFSAAEAFVRIQRLLQDKEIVLVLCGCPVDSSVGLALRSVDLWTGGMASDQVEVFENLNDALEHCENAYLRSLYSKSFSSPHFGGNNSQPLTSQIDVPKGELDSDLNTFEQSPRASHLRLAAKETMSTPEAPLRTNFQQPLPLLLQSLRPFSPELNEDTCFRLAPYFKRVHVERGTTIWTAGSESDSFYLIESGMLRASYLFLDRSHSICESMVAGTAAGEMTFLSRTKRNATVVAERDSVLWKMEVDSHEEMGKREGWKFCRMFEQCLMRIACEEQEVLMGHLISSL